MIKRLRDYNIKDKTLSIIKYLILNKKYNVIYFYILLEKIKSKIIRIILIYEVKNDRKAIFINIRDNIFLGYMDGYYRYKEEI